MPPTGRLTTGFAEQLQAVVGEDDRAVRGALFRRFVSTLARGAAGDSAPPLEGAGGEPLGRAVQLALAAGLLDEAAALPPEVVGVALYELAAELPSSPERRELGRRVLSSFLEGAAPTFVAVATRMAVHGGKGLAGPGVSARLALSLWLPASSDVAADGLAFAIAMRRDLAARFLGARSTGALADRRLAARLLERAASEAALRARGGAAQATDPFTAVASDATEPSQRDIAAQALARLLADRESLVWRHAAVARGVLAEVTGLEPILRDLAPTLSVTEWRRAATALAAAVSVTPDAAVSAVADLLRSPLVERDPGIAQALAWGLERPLAREEDAAREVLGLLSELAPLPACESVAELLAAPAFAPLREPFSAQVEASLAVPEDDAGLRALGRLLLAELELGRERTHLERELAAAVDSFEHEGANVAHLRAVGALDAARSLAAELGSGKGEERELDALRLLARTVLESECLEALLLLERRGDDTARAEEIVGLETQLGRHLEERLGSDARATELALPMRRMRALVHLLDARASEVGADRTRRLAAAALAAVAIEAPSAPLRRGRLAAAVRALDAGVRDEAFEPVDVALTVWGALGGAADLAVCAEATANPDVRELLHLLSSAERAQGDGLVALRELARALPVAASQRVDALRDALGALVRALQLVAGARSQGDLAQGEPHAQAPLEALAGAVRLFEQAVRGAELRCLGRADAGAPDFSALEAALRGGLDPAPSADELATLLERAKPPRAFATVAAAVRAISALPEGVGPTPSIAAIRLPAWLGPKRVIGGFHVLRALGAGGAGSVFVASRSEERDEEGAERFALKVPDYHARLVAQITEPEFLRLFRKEASALLELPESPHLARFVTFDAGARPKPILVMELVEGTRLDKAIASGELHPRAMLSALSGILEGLSAMHQIGVGHLDLKPANVILRPRSGAVLVDFGLSGRSIRPACTTPGYAAPEVWDPAIAPAGTPLTADVYAFGCLAYEVLTGHTLFDADTEVAVLGRHLAHDGMPPPVRALSADPKAERIGMFLFECLRRDPAARATVADLRRQLPELERAVLARA